MLIMTILKLVVREREQFVGLGVSQQGGFTAGQSEDSVMQLEQLVSIMMAQK